MPALTLRPLTAADEAAFLAGLKLWEGEALSWYSFAWKPGMSYAEMMVILENEAAGVNLAPGRVPHTMLYAFVAGEIIGRVSVRHTLNEYLRHRGGHIGYAVAPLHRKKGYAALMVAGALDFCRGLGLDAILVTCGDGNTPSWKLIENFGGVLENKIWDEEDKETIRRYWITL